MWLSVISAWLTPLGIPPMNKKISHQSAKFVKQFSNTAAAGKLMTYATLCFPFEEKYCVIWLSPFRAFLPDIDEVNQHRD